MNTFVQLYFYFVTVDNPPQFVELQDTTIPMDTQVGTAVYVVEVKDDDPGDAALKVEQTSSSQFFEFDDSTSKV